MQSFTGFLTEDYLSEATIPDNIKDVLSGLKYEIDNKKSSSGRTIIIVRDNDRIDTRDDFFKSLKDAGIDAEVKDYGSSSIEHIWLTDKFEDSEDNKDKTIIVVFKPAAGGMQETTLNSSITELFPCIAWENGWTNLKSVDDFYQKLITVDTNTLKCVGSQDMEAAKETIAKAPDSSKYQTKMENALGILKYLKIQNKQSPIKSILWGYRAKPSGVDGKHPGDMYITFNDNKVLGVSLKAGGKSTHEAKLNTYVNPVWEAFGKQRELVALRKKLHKEVYSKIPDMPSETEYDTRRGRKITGNILKAFKANKKTSQTYEDYYDEQLEIMRKSIIDLFNKNPKQSFKYIKENILRNAPDVPTIVIKGVGNDFQQVTDDDEVGVFLAVTKYIVAYKSMKSKQNWHIDLVSGGGKETLTMNMVIRSNKGGHAGVKKLGQYYNLSVKFNSISK
jgi:hypothetical protein